MLWLRNGWLIASVVSLTWIAGGCGGGQASRVEMPGINPSDAGKKAVEMYDTNHDGTISGDELNQCPAIKASLSLYDNGGDGKVTAATIARRLQQWLDARLSLTTVLGTVQLDGKLLAGAAVTLEPEPFLGPTVEAASGTSDANGSVMLTATGGRPGVVRVGLYKVKISKKAGGEELIPARYNAQTELGIEVAQDSLQLGHSSQVFWNLKSR